jgi:hypothetical protein
MKNGVLPVGTNLLNPRILIPKMISNRCCRMNGSMTYSNMNSSNNDGRIFLDCAIPNSNYFLGLMAGANIKGSSANRNDKYNHGYVSKRPQNKK